MTGGPMILRNSAHPKGINLGPSRTFEFSAMEMIAGAGENTGSGGWSRKLVKPTVRALIATQVANGERPRAAR